MLTATPAHMPKPPERQDAQDDADDDDQNRGPSASSDYEHPNALPSRRRRINAAVAFLSGVAYPSRCPDPGTSRANLPSDSRANLPSDRPDNGTLELQRPPSVPQPVAEPGEPAFTDLGAASEPLSGITGAGSARDLGDAQGALHRQVAQAAEAPVERATKARSAGVVTEPRPPAMNAR